MFVGIAFGAGWTPCLGPTLGAILLLAANETELTKGIMLLTAYSMGLAVPFLLSALAIERFLGFFQQFKAQHWPREPPCRRVARCRWHSDVHGMVRTTGRAAAAAHASVSARTLVTRHRAWLTPLLGRFDRFEQLLSAEQQGVAPILRHQLLMRALLNDAPRFEHNDVVGIANGAHAVRRNDGGALR
ncbi:MAG: hypothetical protein HEQ11_03840 [Gemmatimonas sp.]